MVLLDEIFHLAVNLRQRIGTLLKHLLLGEFTFRSLDHRINLAAHYLISHVALFDITHDIGAQRVIGLQLLSVFHHDDVIAGW